MQGDQPKPKQETEKTYFLYDRQMVHQRTSVVYVIVEGDEQAIEQSPTKKDIAFSFKQSDDSTAYTYHS
jgi:hypothetical protein